MCVAYLGVDRSQITVGDVVQARKIMLVKLGVYYW